MINKAKKNITKIVQKSIKEIYSIKDLLISVERTKDEKFGDFSTNAAMMHTNRLKEPPMSIGEKLCRNINKSLSKDLLVDKVELVKPGFINFYISKKFWIAVFREVVLAGENYGRNNAGEGKKILVEFVGSNPTGPLNVVSARAASIGDSLCNILSFNGYDVKREFYINDAGEQVSRFVESLIARYKQIYNPDFPFPDEGYYGDYVKDMAKELDKIYGRSLLDKIADDVWNRCRSFYLSRILGNQKRDVEDFGVKFDVWFSEKTLHVEKINNAWIKLKKLGFTYPKDGALWFQSTKFGDDEDRVLIRKLGAPTYFMADIAYHLDKLERGFDKAIDFMGPDHHGHIARLKMAMKALGIDEKWLDVFIVQQVNLMRGGEKIKMSKRAGRFETMRDLVSEVGKDAARFFFLMRSQNSQLDFDLNLAKEESSKNPVYYVQYAHARICNILKHAEEIKINIEKIDKANTELINKPEEIELAKILAGFGDICKVSALTYAPHRIAGYLLKLAGIFHNFYNKHRVVTENKELTAARLLIVKSTRIVLANGLRLLGISAPEKM
ncbi:arginine--tRNA ligase [bacterium]|nr:arginine--tRNA ligase [bacterium]